MKPWAAVLIIALFASALTIPWLDRPFTTRGEAREALVVERMLTTGNWLLPNVYDNGVPSKPPLLHWLASLVHTLIGSLESEFLVRLVSSFSGIVFVTGFVWLLSLRYPPKRALLAGIMLSTSLEWYRAGSSYRVDLLFSSLLAGSWLLAFRWWENGQKDFPYLSAILLALACLTKGPVALVLGGAGLTLFLLVSGVRSLRAYLALAIWLLPATGTLLLWYMVGWLEGGGQFLAKFWYENVQRFTSTTEDKPHDHSIPFLIGTLFLGFLPWTFALVECAIRERLSWARFKAWYRALLPFERYSFVFSLLVLVFFSIPSSKRGVYLLPAYPFLAFLLSQFSLSLAVWSLSFVRALAFALSGLSFLAVLAAVCSLFSTSDPMTGGVTLNSWSGVISSFLAIGRAQLSWFGCFAFLVMLSFALITLRLKDFFWATAALMISVSAAVQGVVGAPLADLASPKRWAAGELKELLKSDPPLYSFGTEFYALSYYLKRPFLSVGEHFPEYGYIFLEEGDLERFERLIPQGVAHERLKLLQAPIATEDNRIVVVKIGQASADNALDENW